MSFAECWLSFNDKNEKKIIVKFHLPKSESCTL